MVTTKHCI